LLELLTNAEMADVDAAAIASGTLSIDLMEHAGYAVASEAIAMVKLGANIAVLCGPGKNGGDGFAAARILRDRGFRARVALFGEVCDLKGDVAEMASRWNAAVGSFEVSSLHALIDEAALVIDAIFGAGLNRDLPPEVEQVTDLLLTKTVLAVDVPSGLDGSTGTVPGGVLPATRTVTFVRKKLGHVLFPGRSLCGEVHVADIGVSDEIVASAGATSKINAPETFLELLPLPGFAAHKYTRGHVLAISGPPNSTGASRLAARAALRAGAGAVTLASSMEAAKVNAAHLTAIMIAPFETDRDFLDVLNTLRYAAFLIGPASGVGAETADKVRAMLQGNRPGVLDADALGSFADAGESELLFELTRANAKIVMTPHEGEFVRLFGAIPGSKVERAMIAAKHSGATIVLKGADTVIATAHAEGVFCAVSDNAPPWLATAGSGDVLAGFIAGLLAQGMQPHAAACAGVWLHGECGNILGPGLIAEDLSEGLPKVLAKFQSALFSKPSQPGR
jgi:ADP-dependent NAD(P)H-hydrate dehydratase / NAD(P)H-hydrate epimerase